MKAGIAASTAPCVLISMSDRSDEAHVVNDMVALATDGPYVVAGSRYMRGGDQRGGGLALCSGAMDPPRCSPTRYS